MSITEALRLCESESPTRSNVGDLRAYLEAAECIVRKVGDATIDVSIPRAPSDAQALREIAIYLTAWGAMHPQAYARIVGEGNGESE